MTNEDYHDQLDLDNTYQDTRELHVLVREVVPRPDSKLDDWYPSVVERTCAQFGHTYFEGQTHINVNDRGTIFSLPKPLKDKTNHPIIIAATSEDDCIYLHEKFLHANPMLMLSPNEQPDTRVEDILDNSVWKDWQHWVADAVTPYFVIMRYLKDFVDLDRIDKICNADVLGSEGLKVMSIRQWLHDNQITLTEEIRRAYRNHIPQSTYIANTNTNLLQFYKDDSMLSLFQGGAGVNSTYNADRRDADVQIIKSVHVQNHRARLEACQTEDDMYKALAFILNYLVLSSDHTVVFEGEFSSSRPVSIEFRNILFY